MEPELKIEKANIEEMPDVLAALKAAAIWLKAQGRDQWRHWLAPDKAVLDWVQKGFENGEFYLARLDRDIAGVFFLSWNPDEYWKHRGDTAGYLHAFAVNRDMAGKGIGEKMLGWMKDYCAKNRVKYLRLDCHFHNPGLRKYYESRGFIYAGEHEGTHGKVALYENLV